MGCKVTRFDDGTSMISCSWGASQACEFCGAPHKKLCDFELVNGGTCDAYMCNGCAKSVGVNRDYCPGHAAKEGEMTTITQGEGD